MTPADLSQIIQLSVTPVFLLAGNAGFLNVMSGLLVCLLIVTLFVDSYWQTNMGGGVVVLFVLAMLSLIVALVLFIQETFLGTRTLRKWDEMLNED